MSLREQIEGLPRFIATAHGMDPEPDERFAGWVKFHEVLRIIAAHDESSEVAQAHKEIAALRAQLVPIPDVTPGGLRFRSVDKAGPPPVGQAGGEEFRPGLPSEALRKVCRVWECENDEPIAFWRGTHGDAQWRMEQTHIGVGPVDSFKIKLARLKMRPFLKTWAEVEQMARDAEVPAFVQPTMNCPRCGKEYPDFDGIGVAYCPPPDGCGYCRHLSREGQPDGSMKCGFCGDVEAAAPNWRQRLAKREDIWNNGNAAKHEGEFRAALVKLRELATLADVIASGKGKAMVPEGVAALLHREVPTGTYVPYGPNHWNLASPLFDVVFSTRDIAAAIDAYGNALVGDA